MTSRPSWITDFAAELDQDRLQRRAQTPKVDLEQSLHDFVYVHPSSTTQLLRLMPDWMTDKSKRVTLARIVARLKHSRRLGTLGKTTSSWVGGRWIKEEILAAPPWFCPRCFAIENTGETFICQGWKCAATLERCDRVPQDVGVKQESELLRQYCVTQAALLSPMASWARFTVSNGVTEPMASLILNDNHYVLYMCAPSGWKREDIDSIVSSPIANNGSQIIFLVRDVSEFTFVASILPRDTRITSHALVLELLGVGFKARS